MLPQIQLLSCAKQRRRTGATKDETLAPVAWQAHGGDGEAYVRLTLRAQYALGRVEDEAREEAIRHTWATFRPRFVTAMRATRGTQPTYESGSLVRRGRPRLTFTSDGSIRSSADLADERVDGEGETWRISDFVAADDVNEAAGTVELRLEAARDAEMEAPAKPRSVRMTAELRAFRAHVEEQVGRGHVPCWRSCALRILNLRGAWGHGCCDDDPEGELDEATPQLPVKLREFLAAVERRMSRPAPRKAGRGVAWAAHANPANLARGNEAKALTTRLFALLGVECQKGSSAEQKAYKRSDEAAEFEATLAQAGDAYESGDTSAALALWERRSRTLDGSPYIPAGKTSSHPL